MPLFPESENERREDIRGREIFDRAVERAAEIATQNVARIHRIRLVTQSFLAALAISALVSGLVALGIYTLVIDAQRANSLYNCNLLRSISVPLANFVSSDARLREQQAMLTPKVSKVFTQLLGKSEFARDQAKSAKLNAQAVAYWRKTIAPQLTSVEAVNCSAHIH